MIVVTALLIATQGPYHWHTQFVATSNSSVVTYGGESFKCYVTDLAHRRSWTAGGKQVGFIGKDTLREFQREAAKFHIHGAVPHNQLVITASGPLKMDSIFVRLGSSSPKDDAGLACTSDRPDQMSCVTSIQSKLPVDDVQFGFTNSPWRKIGSYDVKTGIQHGVPMNPKFVWTPWSKGDDPEVSVDLRPGDSFDSTDLRVIARRRDGTCVSSTPEWDDFPIFGPEREFGMCVGIQHDETVQQANDDVVEYEFQERNFTWIEFKDVRLSASITAPKPEHSTMSSP